VRIHAIGCAVVLLSTLATTGPARAGGEGRAVLLFGPGASNADGIVAAGYARERLPARERPDERVGVTGIPFPADRDYWMTGDGRVAWCAGTAPEELSVVLGRAREALDLLESERVIDGVDRFLAAAPCLTRAVEPAKLAELYLLRGLANHVDGRTAAAREDFAAASGIHPELRWDVGYPPDPQQTYLVAREETLAADPAQFGFTASLVAGLEATVDGRAMGGLVLHELYPGPHLLQIQGPEGPPVSAMLHLEAGDTAVMLDRYGASAAAMTGPHSELTRVAARTMLDALAAQWTASSVVVVDTTFRKELGEPRVYRYDVGSREFETLSAIRNLRKHMPRHADRVRLGVSGGVLFEGGAVAAPGEDQGSTESHTGIDPSGSIEVRIGSGFTPRAALHIQLHALGGGQLFAAPELVGGFGYRWRPRVLQTYVGLALRYRTRARALGDITGRFPLIQDAETGTATVSPLDTALGIDVNIDIVTPRLPTLYFRVGGSAAFYWSGARDISLCAGAGLRL